MNSDLEITVAICTLNRAQLLRETLTSFEAVTLRPNLRWELLVVDNGSTDDTMQVLRDFEGRLPIRVETEPRRGQSAARNRVIATARGHIVLWTDDDVRADPQLITATLNTFDRFEADIVFGRSYPIWREAQPEWYGPAFAGQFAILDYGTEGFVVTDQDHPFYGLNVAFRRQALDALGPVREDMGYVGSSGGGGEDTEYFDRAMKLGLRIVYAPDSVVGHVIPGERATLARQRRFAWSGARSNYQLVREQCRTFPMLLGVPRFMFALAAQDALAYVKGNVTRDRSEAFYREIRLIRFAGLLREAVRQRAAARNATANTVTNRSV